VPEFKTHGKLRVQKVFPYDLVVSHGIHSLQTDGQTDGRQPCQ